MLAPEPPISFGTPYQFGCAVRNPQYAFLKIHLHAGPGTISLRLMEFRVRGACFAQFYDGIADGAQQVIKG